MAKQLDLFETAAPKKAARPAKPPKPKPKALARNTDSKSSHDAADRFEASTAMASHIGLITDQIYLHPGLTSKQLTEHCDGMSRDQVARRLSGMEKNGEIYSLGRKTSGDITWHPGKKPEGAV